MMGSSTGVGPLPAPTLSSLSRPVYPQLQLWVRSPTL